MKLTDMSIKKAKPKDKSYKLTDGGGLHLAIMPTGGKLWRYAYRFAGKQKLLALGRYPDISLREARESLLEARNLLAQGVDPMAAKKAHKAAGKERAANTFEAVAREWFDSWKTLKSDGHAHNTSTQLERYVFPYIGKRPIAEISAPEILSVLRRIESNGTIHAAHRAKTIISTIMKYAIATSRAERDPVPDLCGALKPKPRVENFAALTEPAEVAALLRAIDAFKGGAVVKAALRLSPLLFVRPGELRNMKWAEIDFDAAEWRFLSTKRGKEMIIPLSRQAVEILKDLQLLTGDCTHVFKGNSRQTMSNRTVNQALLALGYCTKTQITGHGFRAMARTMLRERLNFDPAIIEFQLSHGTKDPLGYDRAKYREERRRMMQAWSDYLDGLKSGNPGNLIPFPAAV